MKKPLQIFIFLALTIFLTAQSAFAIVGGHFVEKNDPLRKHTVIILFGEFPSRCTGVIVSPNVILTAAHCAPENTGHNKQEYVIGFTNDMDPVLSGEEKLVARFVVNSKTHPNYKAVDPLSDDLALLILNGPVPEGYEKATLPRQELEIPVGTKITPYGFGLQNKAGVPKPGEGISLNKKELLAAPFPSPDLEMNFKFEYHRIYLRQPQGGICRSDSGGPVFLNVDSDPILVAVNGAIFGGGPTSCADQGYVTRIDSALDWIKAEIAAASLPSR